MTRFSSHEPADALVQMSRQTLQRRVLGDAMTDATDATDVDKGTVSGFASTGVPGSFPYRTGSPSWGDESVLFPH
jgi:hypothetical protein